MVGIHVEDDSLVDMVKIMGCKVRRGPIKYLGTSLSGTQNRWWKRCQRKWLAKRDHIPQGEELL